jgi:hypothetical protein
MRLWDYEIMRWWDDEMMRWWDDEMMRWWDDEIMRWWDDEMMRWWDDEMMRWLMSWDRYWAGPFTHNDGKHPDTTSANNLVSFARRGRPATEVGADRGVKASMGGGTVSRPSNHSASTLVTVADENQVSTHAASASASNAGGAADRPISHTTSNGAASRPKPAPKRPAPAPAPPPAKPVKKLHRPNYS